MDTTKETQIEAQAVQDGVQEDTPKNPKEVSRRRARIIVGAAVALVLIVTLGYVGQKVMSAINPKNTYETALLCTVEDVVETDGVLLFEETVVSGSGEIGYLVKNGERVSSGTAVAEVYSSSEQSALRTQLTDLESQIALLEKSQNASSTQIDSLLKERTTSLYTLMEGLDRGSYSSMQENKEAYLLAQNKLGVTTGEVSDFATQIAALKEQYNEVKNQLGTPTQITAPTTGYFIGAQSTRCLSHSAEEIEAMSAVELNEWLKNGADASLENCAGKIVSSFTWYYYGVCTAKQSEKLLGTDGKPLKSKIQIRFPGQMESALSAQITEVTVDSESGLARFVLKCDSINADVLKLGQATAQIIVGSYTGLRVNENAIHYVREDTTEDGGENYIPGVYIKYGNMARFRRIDPVDTDHPRIMDGDYVIVLESGTKNSISELRLYDEIIVTGQNLYDGKLL